MEELRTITPAAYCIILLVAYVTFKKGSFKAKYINVVIICAAVEFLYIQGNFIIIGEKTPVYEYLISAILLLYTTLALYGQKVNKSMFQSGMIFLAFIICGILYQSFYPLSQPVLSSSPEWDKYVQGFLEKYPSTINEETYLYFFRLVTFVFSAIAVKKIYTTEDYKKSILIFSKIGKIQIIYSLFEIFVKNQLNSNIINQFNNWFFGEESVTYDVLKFRSNLAMIQGFTGEPSFLAWSLFSIWIFVLLDYYITKRKSNKFFLASIAFIWIISTSFAGLYYLVLAMILVWQFRIFLKGANLSIDGNMSAYRRIIRVNNSVLLLTCFVFIPIILVLFYNIPKFFPGFMYSARINTAYNELYLMLTGQWYVGLTTFTSESARFIGIIDTMKVFFERPFIGAGLGVVSCFGGLATVLGSIGILGLLLWWKFTFSGITFKYNGKIIAAIIILASNVLIGRDTMLMYTFNYIFINALSGFTIDITDTAKNTV